MLCDLLCDSLCASNCEVAADHGRARGVILLGMIVFRRTSTLTPRHCSVSRKLIGLAHSASHVDQSESHQQRIVDVSFDESLPKSQCEKGVTLQIGCLPEVRLGALTLAKNLKEFHAHRRP
jgi:hypothetical protein